jgi:hypothetical protein
MEIYNDFKQWANKNISKGKKVPDRNQLRSYIEKMYGVYDSKIGWKGLRFKNEEETNDNQ